MTFMKLLALPVLVLVLLAGCATERTAPVASTVTVTATPSATLVTPVTASPTSPSAEASGPCTDGDLTVTNGPLESADTQRRVSLSFKNTSTHACTLVGYPGADLVTPAGGVLIHVADRPANAAHRLTLRPGDVATADITAYAVDTSSGTGCARWGNVVVTAPGGAAAHPTNVDMPICDASISSVD
jgi:hypothetical protein